MAKKNSATAGEAVQAQAAAAPATPAAASAPDAGATTPPAGEESDDDDSDDEHEADDEHPDDDPEKASLREQVQRLTARNQELQQQLTDERQRSGDIAGELNESEKLVEELQGRLRRSDAAQAESGTLVVSDGQADYKVLLRQFKYKHVEYKADELKDNPQLVAELVAAGVGFLHQITAGE